MPEPHLYILHPLPKPRLYPTAVCHRRGAWIGRQCVRLREYVTVTVTVTVAVTVAVAVTVIVTVTVAVTVAVAVTGAVAVGIKASSPFMKAEQCTRTLTQGIEERGAAGLQVLSHGHACRSPSGS